MLRMNLDILRNRTLIWCCGPSMNSMLCWMPMLWVWSTSGSQSFDLVSEIFSSSRGTSILYKESSWDPKSFSKLHIRNVMISMHVVGSPKVMERRSDERGVSDLFQPSDTRSDTSRSPFFRISVFPYIAFANNVINFCQTCATAWIYNDASSFNTCWLSLY